MIGYAMRADIISKATLFSPYQMRQAAYACVHAQSQYKAPSSANIFNAVASRTRARKIIPGFEARL